VIKIFFTSMILFVIFDFIWLGFVVRRFNMEQLAEIGRFKDGQFQLMYVPAILVYFLLAAAVTFFVLPQTSADTSLVSVFLFGALMGLVLYGVYDLTNLSILKNYPIPFALADIAWGAFVVGSVSLSTWKISSLYF
jgi:uncharacterized membrane protein